MFPSPGIGDIIAICQLIIKVGTVICESRDVPQEYEELTRELSALYELLQTVKNLDDPGLSLAATLILQRIQRQAKSCEEAMDDFLKNNSPPRSKTRKAVWVIRAPARAASLRQKLSTHRQMIGIFLNEFRNQEQADRIERQTRTLQEHTASLHGQTRALAELQLLARVQTSHLDGHTNSLYLLQSLMREQAASLEGWRAEARVLRPVLQGITLIDAVGSCIEVPFLFCRTYELFSDILLAYFKNEDRPGRNFVLRGDYDLVHGGTRSVVSPAEWAFLLRPDLEVEMSMILRQKGDEVDRCPRCRMVFRGEAVNGWATCAGCPGQFRITKRTEESVDMQNEINSRGTTTQRTNSSPSMLPEWTAFRLLSVISTILAMGHSPELDIAMSLADDDLPVDSRSTAIFHDAIRQHRRYQLPYHRSNSLQTRVTVPGLSPSQDFRPTFRLSPSSATYRRPALTSHFGPYMPPLTPMPNTSSPTPS